MIKSVRLMLQVTALALLSSWLFFSGLMVVERTALLGETSQQDERALVSLEQALQPESVTLPIDQSPQGEAVVLKLAPQPSLQPFHDPSTRSDLPPVGLRSRHLYQVFLVYRI